MKQYNLNFYKKWIEIVTDFMEIKFPDLKPICTISRNHIYDDLKINYLNDGTKITPSIKAKMIKIIFQEFLEFIKFLNPTDYSELNVLLRKELGIDVTTFKSKMMNKIVKSGKLKTDEEYEFVKNIICDTTNYDFYSQEFLDYLNELLSKYEGSR